MSPSSPDPRGTAARRRGATTAGAILAVGAALTAWALWDVRHPTAGPDYAHYFIARDADCLQSYLITIEVPRLPWRMDLAALSRAPVSAGHCAVGWNRAEFDRVWSSAPDAPLVLRLAPGLHPTHLSASLVALAPVTRPEPVSIRLAGKPAGSPGGRPLFAIRVRSSDPFQVDATLPKADGADLTLLFHFDRIDTPSRLDPAGDQRHLGLALLRLQLR